MSDQTSAFVTDGAVIIRELGFEGLMTPIPDGESAVAALTLGRDGRVYGLTRGKRSHLFVYHNFPVEDCVLKLGAIMEETGGGNIVCARNGMIYGMVYGKDPASAAKIKTVMFKYDPSGDSIGSEMSLHLGKPVLLPCPVDGKVISKLAIDAEADTIYGMTLPAPGFFAYEIGSGKFKELATVEGAVVSKTFCLADERMIYGAGQDGRIFRLCCRTGKVEFTNMFIPCGKGKEYVNEAAALVFDPARRVIYGGTLIDGYLFKIELDKARVICLGKPTEQRPIRCLTVGNDGKVFGIAGEPSKGICHLFRYDPESGDLRDLGIPCATTVKSWVAHEIDAICTNRNGHIVMGENDRMSHLLIYYPPVDKK